MLILGQGIPGVNQTNADGLMRHAAAEHGHPARPRRPTRWRPWPVTSPASPTAGASRDDVVDIEIRAVADGYGSFLAETFGLPNLEPNNAVGDGCSANDVRFTRSFPYLGAGPRGLRRWGVPRAVPRLTTP